MPSKIKSVIMSGVSFATSIVSFHLSGKYDYGDRNFLGGVFSGLFLLGIGCTYIYELGFLNGKDSVGLAGQDGTRGVDESTIN